ncbi:MAG: M42 family peptidase [Capsulimonadaceae bacterium]
MDAPSPSGYEQPAQEVFREAVTPYADDVRTDIMGNVTAVLNPAGAPRLMLAGHCDEIGFLVTHVNTDGYLYFGSIGGHDANITVGQRVYVHTETGPVLGVVGRRPIHTMEPEERGRRANLHDLFVDIGATGKPAVVEKVAIGDPITYAAGFAALEGGLAVAHGFDNKVGAFVIAQAIRRLHECSRSSGSGTSAQSRSGQASRRTLTASIYGVSTVQEEVGHRGARTSAYDCGATVGIAVDVDFATDFPGMNKNRYGDVELGKGPTICRGANNNPEVFRLLCEVARDLDVPFQVVANGGGTGTDANDMQINQAGMATGLVSVPLRYMHTPCEVVSLHDIERTITLLVGFALRITPESDFTPRMANRHSSVRLPARKDRKIDDKED